MMQAALRLAYPEYAERLAGYSAEYWAKFTYQVLLYGLRRTKRFIAWPDTQRLWAKHLSPEQNKYLEQFLPPLSVTA